MATLYTRAHTHIQETKHNVQISLRYSKLFVRIVASKYTLARYPVIRTQWRSQIFLFNLTSK